MHSPSPASRRNYSARNVSWSPSRTDLPRGNSSSSSVTRRGLDDGREEYKENNAENGVTRGNQGRSNHNPRGSPKKPWVTHFSKPSGPLSPSNRVLVDRNSSASPTVSTSDIRGYGDGLGDRKIIKTPVKERDEAAPVICQPKGVAELSKRIQQFLEDQDILLGIKSGRSHEVSSSSASITPEAGNQGPVSPYNPYRSPFSERPQFLRLNANAAGMDESDNTESPSLKMSNMNMNEDIDALAVHEADQILSNPQPQTDFPSILSPLSPDNDVTTQVGASGECIPEGKHVDASLDALPAIYEGLTKSESYSTSSVIQCPAQAPISLLGQCEFPDNQDQDEDQEIDSSQTAGAKAQSQGGTVNTPEVKNEEVNQTDDESPPGHLPCQFPDEKLEFPEGKEHITDQDEIQSEFGGEQASHHSESSLVRNDTEMPVSAEIDDPGYDQDHLSWGEMFGKGMFIVTFVALTLLAYGGSGLLPLSLVDNPVKSIWHSSKYHEQSITLLSGMKGLWAQESTHSYVDVQIVVLRGLEIMNSIRRSSSKAQKEVHTYLQVAISVVDDWKKVLMQHNLFGKNPNVDLEQEDRGRQFEWIQDLQFEEEWLDEAPPYTDWELLHEYDLGAANEFILASVPEPLKDNLRKNFSRLSDSFEVQGLLEELMRLKGGDTEEDRLEVLQYFWEYTRFSASAHKTLANYHNEQKGMEDEDIQLDSYSGPSSENLPDETSGGVEEPVTVSAAPQSGTAFVDELDLGSVRSQDQQGHPKDEEADFSPAAAVQEIEIEKQISQLDHSVNEFDSNSALFEMNQEIYLEKQVGLELGPASSESSQSIEELGSSIALLELQQNFETKNGGFDVEKKSSHAFYTDVGRKNQNSDGHFDVCQQTTKEHIHEAESTKAEPYAVIPLITALITLSALAIIVGLARSRKLNDAAKLVPPLSKHVEFLQKSLHMQGNVEDEIIYPSSKLLADSNGDKQDITMIEELNERFASVLRSPEPSLSGRLSSVAKGEDSSRSPVPVPSASSPYGSFTTYKLVSKKEGQAMETKLTPVRRSSRIRNHANISPKVDALKRVAISPP